MPLGQGRHISVSRLPKARYILFFDTFWQLLLRVHFLTFHIPPVSSFLFTGPSHSYCFNVWSSIHCLNSNSNRQRTSAHVLVSFSLKEHAPTSDGDHHLSSPDSPDSWLFILSRTSGPVAAQRPPFPRARASGRRWMVEALVTTS